MPEIPPAIPLHSPQRVDPQQAPQTGDHEAAPRSPVEPASMHRAEDDAAARADSRDFDDDAPRPSDE